MKPLLMHTDRDFDLQQPLPWNEHALMEDLELVSLVRAMAWEDEFLADVARRAMLSGLQNGSETILHRQEILKDCLAHPSIVRELYSLAVEALDEERKHHFFEILSKYPSSVLRGSIEQLETHVAFLKRLRDIARRHASEFISSGFSGLFAMLDRELSDEYFGAVEGHLKQLMFRHGVLVSAELGEANEGRNYALRKPHAVGMSWFQRALLELKRILPGHSPEHVVWIAERDEAGTRALSELRDRGIATVASAVAQAAEQIQSFFRTLRAELAFYVGCLNLYDRLAAKGVRLSFPEPTPSGRRTLHFRGLRDVPLALSVNEVVANSLDLDAKNVVVITGANQGGKSTFLRSVGVAQLMMQSGMFVAAEAFAADLCARLFTHYRREEDATMQSGKLDEELRRVSEIVDTIEPHSMILFNESFAATNEREGSEIARQVVTALHEHGMRVLYVTHLYEFAHALADERIQDAAFLRAERTSDGARTFRVVEGEPLETSYGEDLYELVFERGRRPTGQRPAAALFGASPASTST